MTQVCSKNTPTGTEDKDFKYIWQSLNAHGWEFSKNCQWKNTSEML